MPIYELQAQSTLTLIIKADDEEDAVERIRDLFREAEPQVNKVNEWDDADPSVVDIVDVEVD